MPRKKKIKVIVEEARVEIPKMIVKRDGRVVPFEVMKIERAIKSCFENLSRESGTEITELARRVVNIVGAKYAQPTVEQVQDAVEVVLQAAGEFSAAKHYILYRAEHAKMRESRPIPLGVTKAFEESDQYFFSPIQKFQFFDKYSRFDWNLGRRETWKETVDRAVNYLAELADGRLGADDFVKIRRMVLGMKVAPSMRLLAMAGEAARRNNIGIYNCSYLPVDSIDAYVEALMISMNGCGVGFSVESKYVENLPRVKRQTGAEMGTHLIEDTTEGWAEAVRLGLSTWFDGGDIKFDYSTLRRAGAILRVKGGRSSGPEPLHQTLEFARSRILSRQGSFLRPVDAHDIMCQVGSAAVSGGMRRTAMISLFDWDDKEMMNCKSGDFERDNSQRWNANNSAVWPESGLTQLEIMKQMLAMVESGRGEPGIFNRRSAINLAPARRKTAVYGCNPCGEINLRPFEFCNLSIVIARAEDTYESLKEKVETATLIGTIQSLATHFPGLRGKWKENCEEERLLGVDINGQLDSKAAQDPAIQSRLKQVAVATNQTVAAKLGIKQSAAVTCVKPSGNSAQLFDCSSGLHARWAAYYIRNVRVSAHSPIYKVLRDAGVPMDPENGQLAETATTWVVHFPARSPAGAITRKQRTAIQQCEYWLQNKIHWTEHNPSVTVTYRPDEVIDLIKWVYEHQDLIGGMTFLPVSDAAFVQMPYQDIDKEEYEQLVEKFPKIDFSKLYRYEEEDYTKAAQELACLAGACEVE